ncbi:MAG TPA: histidine phosphatase family protein [Vicinamibacterales bacterium]|nr:histidine phosphatase family protein [Vicinamibacterales bacterium]
MRLYLVHHAEALPPEIDPQRPLSPSGLAHADRLARAAAARGVRPEIIWHSGKLRARQTAEAFLRHCNPLAAMSAQRGLQPDDAPKLFCELLAAAGTDELLAAGHFPHLERLRASLDPSGSPFPAHGLVALDGEGTSWRELWRLEG